jgi:hypothetical protein
MEVKTTVDVLARILDEHDSRGRTVTNVEATSDGADDGTLHVTMDVPVDLCAAGEGVHAGLAPEDATFTERGTLQVGFSTSELIPVPSSVPATVSVTERDVEVTRGGLVVSVDLTIDPPGDGPPEPEGKATDAAGTVETDRPAPGRAHDADGPGSSESRSEAGPESGSGDGPEAIRDTSVPPYDDTEYLQALYDAHDTFSEMADAILMDVSGETVRRYMIAADVHDPATYETAAEAARSGSRPRPSDDATDGSAGDASRSAANDEREGTSLPDEQLVADGIGLPEDVEITDIIEAVVGSATVYEVERELDLEGERVRGLLQRLDLLDLVLRRIDDGDRRGVTYEEASRRVRRCTDASGEHPAP